MLAAERHSHIIGELKQRGAVRITSLADELNVSPMTVRRDLEELAEHGLLVKVHGGATVRPESPLAAELPFSTKTQQDQKAKDVIGLAASELVEPGSAIALMGGSTVFSLARHLLTIPRLTVVTNSLPISDLFMRDGRSDQTVILTGGLRTPTDSFVGEIAVATLDRINVDLAFLGAHGVDLVGGFSSPNVLEAETNRAIRTRARKLVILADATKWGKVAFSTFASLDEVDCLVTDSALPTNAANTLQARVGQLIIADGTDEPVLTEA
jgi:DeoR/GlpR family transcriptional regulator of sugar metabolism